MEAESAATKVSFIVPAYNATSTLGETVASIREAAKDLPHEVVIVNDASIDDTYALACQLGDIVTTRACQAGAARARNDAVQLATGDVFFFVDSDVTVNPEAVATILSDIEAGADAVFGAYTPLPPPQVRNSPTVFKNLLHHYTHLQSAGPATTFWSGFSAIRREAFFAVHGFDPKVTWSADVEDIHLGYRLTHAGKKIVLDPRAQVMHHKRYTLRKMVMSDLLHRAIPWTKAMLELRTLNIVLNLRGSSIASSLLLYGAILGLLTIPFVSSVGAIAALVGVAGWVVMNRRFLAYAHKYWKPLGATRVAFYLSLMNLYAPVGAAIGVLFFFLRGPHHSIRNTAAFDHPQEPSTYDVTVALVLGHATDAQALEHLPDPEPWWELLVVGHTAPPNLPSHATFVERPPHTGPSDHAQAALEHSRGRMLALLNAREVPQPGWLDRVRHAVARGDLSVGGSFDHDRQSLRRRALGVSWHWRWRPQHPEMWMQDHPPTNCAYLTSTVRHVGGFVHRTGLFRRLSAYGARPVRFDPAMLVASATDVEPLPYRSLFRYAVVSTAVSVHYYDYRKPVRVAMILASPVHLTTHLVRVMGQAILDKTADRTFILGFPGVAVGMAASEIGVIAGLIRPRRYAERAIAAAGFDEHERADSERVASLA